MLRLKSPYRDGTTHIVMQPQDFMQRLAPLVPRPRLHLIRFHGVLAPHAKLRAAIISQPAQKDPSAPVHEHAHGNAARMSWAKLLKRVFDIDLGHCPQCGGALKIIAAIEEPAVIVRILTHLGLHARALAALPGAAAGAIPGAPEGPIHGYDDLTPYGPGVVGRTVGPVKPPAPLIPAVFLDYLIGMVEGAIRLGWIHDKEPRHGLLVDLTDAKAALLRGDTKAARKKLKDALDGAHAGKHGGENGKKENDREDRGEGNEELSAEGAALLRYNLRYLIAGLQSPDKD